MGFVFDPPEVFRDMGAEILLFDEEKESIEVRFPVQARYRNPMGVMQGGMVVAAMDNTYGPLTVLLGTTSVTTHINTTFVKPVARDEPYIIITARVTARSRRHLHLTGEVRDSRGTLVVSGTASFMVLETHDPESA
ncbi:PaaI family thioesterase [Desulfoluna sp.]|uniref:PaaI family thioesterase n=1 Tax=Desulfoluna sp. TaxID=2045199 RepID=UPI00260D0FAD|nr:PaaI family thioesterase [Desulfoluna sp.]